jgi:hypothetical protein
MLQNCYKTFPCIRLLTNTQTIPIHCFNQHSSTWSEGSTECLAAFRVHSALYSSHNSLCYQTRASKLQTISGPYHKKYSVSNTAEHTMQSEWTGNIIKCLATTSTVFPGKQCSKAQLLDRVNIAHDHTVILSSFSPKLSIVCHVTSEGKLYTVFSKHFHKLLSDKTCKRRKALTHLLGEWKNHPFGHMQPTSWTTQAYSMHFMWLPYTMQNRYLWT